MRSLLLFVVQPQAVPWYFVRLLDVNAQRRDEALAYLKAFYELVLMLESSQDPVAVGFVDTMKWLQWTVIREVLNTFAAYGWDTAKCSDYTAALFPGLLQHLMTPLCKWALQLAIVNSFISYLFPKALCKALMAYDMIGIRFSLWACWRFILCP